MRYETLKDVMENPEKVLEAQNWMLGYAPLEIDQHTVEDSTRVLFWYHGKWHEYIADTLSEAIALAAVDLSRMVG